MKRSDFIKSLFGVAVISQIDIQQILKPTTPTLQIPIRSVAIKAYPRKLKCKWTYEALVDIENFKPFEEMLSKEIDMSCIENYEFK